MSLAGVVLLCTLVLGAGRALAGGLEYVGAGAEANGRGGAVTARADNPMVLAYNPAGLAELRGTQFLLDMNLALFDACVDPEGYYGWGLYLGGQNSRLHDDATGQARTLHLQASDPRNASEPYYKTPLDSVCLKQNVIPIPQLAWTTRLSERWGIGAGLIFPAVQPSGSWGGRNGIIHGADGSLRPAPTRYMLLGSSNLGVFPTIGAGYRIARSVRVGLAFEWGIVAVNAFTMASSGGGTIPANDIVAHVKARDWFVPALTASAHFVPVDALDVVFAFRFQDDVDTTGRIDLTTGLFDPSLLPHTTGGLEVTRLRQHMPWKLRGGVRYSNRFAPRVDGTGRGEADPVNPDVIHDPLQDERWDIELDGEYQMNGRNDKQLLEYAAGQQVEFARSGQPVRAVDFASKTEVEKHWRDQISLRLGGTYSVLPGKIGLSAGVHYENRGVDPSYMQVDFWPVSRIGLHAGVIFRIAKSVDLVASYAHIFQETVVVQSPEDQDPNTIWNCYIGKPGPNDRCAAPAGKIETISKSAGPLGPDRLPSPPLEATTYRGRPDGIAKLTQNLAQTAQAQPAFIVNSGRYRSDYNVVAAGLNFHF